MQPIRRRIVVAQISPQHNRAIIAGIIATDSQSVTGRTVSHVNGPGIEKIAADRINPCAVTFGHEARTRVDCHIAGKRQAGHAIEYRVILQKQTGIRCGSRHQRTIEDFNLRIIQRDGLPIADIGTVGIGDDTGKCKMINPAIGGGNIIATIENVARAVVTCRRNRRGI